MGSTAEMPFLDHLEELRWRIIWSLAAIVVGVVLGFFIVLKFNLLLWMQEPITPYLHGHRLMNTHPGGGFSIMMQTAVIIGVVLLFICGALLAWYFVLPMTLRFLTSLGDEAFDQMISANEYFGFVTSMVLAMGAVFELPIAILLLSALGLVTPQFLSKFRRHAVIASYVAAAIITPGDLFVTSVALMVPLYLLYELSIGLSWIVFRKRQRRQAAEIEEEVPA